MFDWFTKRSWFERILILAFVVLAAASTAQLFAEKANSGFKAANTAFEKK